MMSNSSLPPAVRDQVVSGRDSSRWSLAIVSVSRPSRRLSIERAFLRASLRISTGAFQIAKCLPKSSSRTAWALAGSASGVGCGATGVVEAEVFLVPEPDGVAERPVFLERALIAKFVVQMVLLLALHE